ncbi:hypothetical protein RHMOL_Rhmol10G0286400 [Rhododendron molle]|uniref:Uncharacterized protein n=1 Tax=Rhododendron molle TaxID=49168 RepID=A0ACC0M7T0_RHOML|nr:hypothetical protein RHMOL_Rhmol10G0286400 [Rhododendron molle]
MVAAPHEYTLLWNLPLFGQESCQNRWIPLLKRKADHQRSDSSSFGLLLWVHRTSPTMNLEKGGGHEPIESIAVEVEMITVEAFRMLNILDLLSIAQLIMASKPTEDPSGLKTEEPTAKDPPPKSDGGVGNDANMEKGAANAATSESVEASEEARTKGGERYKRSSRSRLDRRVVVRRQTRSGGFLRSFPVIAFCLTWGMWKVDSRRLESKSKEAEAQVLDLKLKKYVHEREALDSIMRDVTVIKEQVIKEKVIKKGGFWAIFQRG